MFEKCESVFKLLKGGMAGRINVRKHKIFWFESWETPLLRQRKSPKAHSAMASLYKLKFVCHALAFKVHFLKNYSMNLPETWQQ